MRAKLLGVLLIVILAGGSLYLAYNVGERKAKKKVWFSELNEATRGTKGYPIDIEIICGNKKDLGKLQIDLNLENGKWRIVRNDNKGFPDCSK